MRCPVHKLFKGRHMMRLTKSLGLTIAVAGCLIVNGTSAHGSIIWGNSASSGNVRLEAFDSVTGLLIPGQQFLVPNLTARADNGRGIAVLGNDIYYTTASSGNIYKTNSVTHADLGIVVNTGFAGIANLATDGVLLYASNYQVNTGAVNKYNLAGGLVGSIKSLSVKISPEICGISQHIGI